MYAPLAGPLAHDRQFPFPSSEWHHTVARTLVLSSAASTTELDVPRVNDHALGRHRDRTSNEQTSCSLYLAAVRPADQTGI